MSFNVNQALAICTANLAKRKTKVVNSYTLFYSNGNGRVDGQMQGSTIKKLIEEFRDNGGAYQFAFIVKSNKPDFYLRFFNRAKSHKFYSMTRTKKA